MEKVMLLDGNSLINRAYYALPGLRNSAGKPTGAVLGFLNMFLKITESERPDYLAVAFDLRGPTLRHEAYANYKAHRTGMPEDLAVQIPMLKEVLTALGIAQFELPGYEADDLLGTLARCAEKAGLEALIVTGDRDALQLVSDRIRVVLTKKGISDTKEYDGAAVQAEYGITPAQVVDLKGLMGDASDNIPGIPGVGEKTALKLIREFGGVDSVLENADRVPGKKLPQLLRDYGDQARLSKRLAAIECEAPLGMRLEDLRRKDPDAAAVQKILTELEFKNLLRRFAPEPEPLKAPPAGNGQIEELEEIDEAVLESGGHLPFEPGSARKVAVYYCPASGVLSFCLRPGRVYRFAEKEDAARVLSECFVDPETLIIGHDLKPLILRHLFPGGCVRAELFDTAVAAYLLDSGRTNFHLESLLRDYGLPNSGTADLFSRSAAHLLIRMHSLMSERLRADGLDHLYRKVEAPMIAVLASMEHLGVRVEASGLEEMGRELETRIFILSQDIFSQAGSQFNINSTRQLGEILFNKLGLPVVKRTKTGPSTDSDVLETLAPRHEIVRKILEYRTLAKLKSTYVDGLKPLIRPETGRIHTTFNQTVAATGRLSSTEPNLQNIPIRMEEGRRIRKLFRAEEGMSLLTADYSQIDLRVLAHYSRDEALVDAFRRDQDIHARTAAEVFEVPMDQVAPDMRRRAKTVNFGLVYGQTDYGLSRELGISRAEAREFIDRYFARYPGVKAYMEQTIAAGREKGYVTTLLGRRRYLPEINSRNRNLRSFAERIAINSPIQGTAADIIKLAMVDLHTEMEGRGLKSRMLLQVHDELIFEIPSGEISEMSRLVRSRMEEALKLEVPLRVDLKTGPNWYDLTPLK